MSLIRLPKHYKETVISKPNAIAQGLADAAQTATKFITDISGSGIWVTPDGAQPSESGSALPTTTGWHISDAIELFKQGASYFKIWLENSVTKVRVGLDSSGHALFTPDGMDILTTATNRIARFGVLTWRKLYMEEAGQSTTGSVTGPGINLSDKFIIVSNDSSSESNGAITTELNDKTIPASLTLAAVNERYSSGTPKYAAVVELNADENGQTASISAKGDGTESAELHLNATGGSYLSAYSDFVIDIEDGELTISDTQGSGYIRDTALSTDWTVSGSTITAGTHSCRRSGNVVTITGANINFGRTFSNGDSVTVGTIPAGYRPPANTYAQAFYSGGDLGSCYFRLDASGNLTFNAIKSLTTSVRAAFTMTFVV